MNDLSIPNDLKALVMWSRPEPATNVVPPGESNDRLEPAEAADTERVVCVSERRGRRIGVWVPAPWIAYWVLTLVFHLNFPGAFALVLLATAALAAMAIKRSGRTGFYQLTPAGTLGEYLGRRRPDLAGMQRTRVSTRI
jgi:hypothetical protein